MRKNAAIMFAMILIGFLLSVDRLPLPIRAQVIPPLSFCCAVLLPLVIWRMRRTPLLAYSLVFILFVLVHSVIAVFIDHVLLNADGLRVVAWLRQVAALLSGFAVFLVLRRLLPACSERQIVIGILLGATPAILIGVANIAWGLTGSPVLATIVRAVRSTVLAGSEMTTSSVSWRAAGLANEPAYFARFLILTVLPLTIAAYALTKSRGRVVLLLLMILACLLWTFSTTGFAVLAALGAAAIVLGPHRRIFFFFVSAAAAGLIVLMLKLPDNYMLAAVGEVVEGGSSRTFESRFYSTTGPLLMTAKSYVLPGYGLGGTSAHFNEVIPDYAREHIIATSWTEMPNLKSLFGRLLVETGVIGVLLLGAVFATCFRQVRRVCSIYPGRCFVLLPIIPCVLVAFLASTLFTSTSLGSPYLWFWLAIADSRYMMGSVGRQPLNAPKYKFAERTHRRASG